IRSPPRPPLFTYTTLFRSSLAAYAARAGMEPVVFLPKGKIAAGKLVQANAFGARIVEVDGSFDDAMARVEAAATGGSEDQDASRSEERRVGKERRCGWGEG